MASKLSLAILLIFFLPCAFAQKTDAPLPQPYSLYVNDFAHYLSADQENQFADLYAALEKETSVEMVLVIVNSSQPYTPQEYRTLLFNAWHVGKKGKDNGMLILYSVEEKRIEVETGYGLEGILPDSKIGRLLDDYYVPYRDDNKTIEGIMTFSIEAVKILQENKYEVLSSTPQTSKTKIFLIILVAIIILIILSQSRRYRGGYYGGSGWPGGSSFGGGSFGGGGFGGGASGGGGAGR